MSINTAWLTMTCTVQEATEGNAYANPPRTWAAKSGGTGVACFLDYKATGKELSGEMGNVISTSTLFIAPGLTVSEGDRITDVKLADGTTLDAGPFDILLAARHSDENSALHHTECDLKRVE